MKFSLLRTILYYVVAASLDGVANFARRWISPCALRCFAFVSHLLLGGNEPFLKCQQINCFRDLSDENDLLLCFFNRMYVFYVTYFCDGRDVHKNDLWISRVVIN